MKLTFKTKNKKLPTPLLVQKFGDALLGVNAFATGVSIVADNKTLSLIFLAIGVLGKFASDFFGDVQEELDKREGEEENGES